MKLHQHVDVERLAKLRFDYADISSNVAENARFCASGYVVWEAMPRSTAVKQRVDHEPHRVMEATSGGKGILVSHLV